jgi:UDP-2,4-diacetamido-2,4,6-trideoxy-beta-L-altropyranose hydrolase
LAANQADVAAALEREGVSHRLEGQVAAENISAALAAELGNCACRQRMSQRGREFVDGWGVSRVVTRMHAARFTLRRAGEQDCRQIWEWANESEVRASAFNMAPIPWETHVSWFNGKLRDAASAIFVGLNADGRAFGQVRFDWDEHGVSEVDVSVDRNQRKAGLGSALICRAVEELFAAAPVGCVKAHIRPGNSASIRAFEKAGFRRDGFVTVHGHQAIRFIIMRADGY